MLIVLVEVKLVELVAADPICTPLRYAFKLPAPEPERTIAKWFQVLFKELVIDPNETENDGPQKYNVLLALLPSIETIGPLDCSNALGNEPAPVASFCHHSIVNDPVPNCNVVSELPDVLNLDVVVPLK